MKPNYHDQSDKVRSMTKTRQDNDVAQVWSNLKLEQNCHDRSYILWFIRKMRQDNNVIDRKGVISVEYEIELSRPIGQCAV